MLTRSVVSKALVGTALLHGFAAGAVQVVPIAYSMPNGTTGGYPYHDESYSGTGCVSCNSATLSGGLGDLTDGVIATQSFVTAEAPAGPGPYVGWRDTSPTIVFSFASSQAFQGITLYLDQELAYSVFSPSAVMINGVNYAITAPTGSGAFSVTFAPQDLVTNSVSITLTRNGSWTFLSEVAFEATAVPELPTSVLMLAGMAGLAGLARRRQARR